MILCGRIFLGAQSPHVIVPRIWARKNYAHEVRTPGWYLAMDPFFPEFLFGARRPWKIWRRLLIPISLSTWKRFSRIRILRHTTQLCRLLLQCNWSFRTTFLWLFAWPFISLNMSEETLSSTCASGLRLVVWHTGGCQILLDKFFFNYHIGVEFLSFGLKRCPHCCQKFGLRIFLSLGQSWPSNLVRENTVVLFVSDHRTILLELVCHDWNYMSLLSNIVHVLSTQHTLTLCSPRRLSFHFHSWWLILFPQLRFGLWSFEFSSSDQCTDVFNRE